MPTYLIDALDLGHNAKGIARTLSSLIPRLVEQSAHDIVIACTSKGARELDVISLAQTALVARVPQTKWEQWDLPRLGSRIGAEAIYSHRECGPLWGPRYVLHLPEDPEVRWKRDPPRSPRDYARRAYSRQFLARSMRHAAVVATSTAAGARQFATSYRLPVASFAVIPLGVDLNVFRPAANPTADTVFHLGSSDPRDRSIAVVDAWAEARKNSQFLPRLVVGGNLGLVENAVRERATALDVDVQLTGRLTDEDLGDHLRNAAVVVQPSSDEGFGLQPLEAMASGAPLIVTHTHTVAEVVGDGAIIRGAGINEIAKGILVALEQSDRLRLRARRRAEGFSWDVSADAVLSNLATAAGSDPN